LSNPLAIRTDHLAIPLSAHSPFPVAKGSPDHFRASQMCSKRHYRPVFEPTMPDGTKTVTEKNLPLHKKHLLAPYPIPQYPLDAPSPKDILPPL
jgi:hypothetical protein